MIFNEIYWLGALLGPLGIKISNEILIMDLSRNQKSCWNLEIWWFSEGGGERQKSYWKLGFWGLSPGAPRIRANRVTGRRTEPGKHAHAFRMTLVGRDKLPQIKFYWCSIEFIDFLINSIDFLLTSIDLLLNSIDFLLNLLIFY